MTPPIDPKFVEMAKKIKLSHYTPQEGLHCTCGLIISVFSEGFPICEKAIEEFAQALASVASQPKPVEKELAEKLFKGTVSDARIEFDQAFLKYILKPGVSSDHHDTAIFAAQWFGEKCAEIAHRNRSWQTKNEIRDLIKQLTDSPTS